MPSLHLLLAYSNLWSDAAQNSQLVARYFIQGPSFFYFYWPSSTKNISTLKQVCSHDFVKGGANGVKRTERCRKRQERVKLWPRWAKMCGIILFLLSLNCIPLYRDRLRSTWGQRPWLGQMLQASSYGDATIQDGKTQSAPTRNCIF